MHLRGKFEHMVLAWEGAICNKKNVSKYNKWTSITFFRKIPAFFVKKKLKELPSVL